MTTREKCIITLPPPITYDYVDLGLPSGTKWATTNVGARKPSDAGLYFQWGDTSGYTADQIGTGDGQHKFASDWSDYKWGKYPNFTKYTTTGATLELEDDAAHANMGGNWHMPAPTQIQELLDNTTNTWTAQDGVNGRLFTSKKEPSKSIFIPASSYAFDGHITTIGFYGDIWSSMLDTNYVDTVHSLYFHENIAILNDSYRYSIRYYGLSVRGVIG